MVVLLAGVGGGFLGMLLDGLLCLEDGVDFPLLELREDIHGDVWIGRERVVDEDCGVGGGGAGGGEG